ncbi:MAG: hypothetical protein Q8O40_01520 [Chloroflexota bacterium]|nr:hypothetical protein [Chloroflexota bacterium]
MVVLRKRTPRIDAESDLISFGVKADGVYLAENNLDGGDGTSAPGVKEGATLYFQYVYVTQRGHYLVQIAVLEDLDRQAEPR